MNEEPKLSRQRRWQKRHPEKFKKIKERYAKSERGKHLQRQYQKAYRERQRTLADSREPIPVVDSPEVEVEIDE